MSHHISVAAAYGSYNQKNIAFVANRGGFHGWSTVIGGGVGSGDSFRQAAFANRTCTCPVTPSPAPLPIVLEMSREAVAHVGAP